MERGASMRWPGGVSTRPRHLCEHPNRHEFYCWRSQDEARYERIAAELDMRPNTLAVTVHRMRARLLDALRAELMQTVGSDAAYRDELADLRGVLAGL